MPRAQYTLEVFAPFFSTFASCLLRGVLSVSNVTFWQNKTF